MVLAAPLGLVCRRNAEASCLHVPARLSRQMATPRTTSSSTGAAGTRPSPGWRGSSSRSSPSWSTGWSRGTSSSPQVSPVPARTPGVSSGPATDSALGPQGSAVIRGPRPVSWGLDGWKGRLATRRSLGLVTAKVRDGDELNQPRLVTPGLVTTSRSGLREAPGAGRKVTEDTGGRCCSLGSHRPPPHFWAGQPPRGAELGATRR